MTTRRGLAVVNPSSEVVYHTLRDRIASCELAPGQWLTERRCAAELGIGLSPVRGALTRLRQDGLVQVVPGEGYRVTPLTCKSVDDLYTAWAVLGPEIVRLGASRADPGQTAELRRLASDESTVLTGPLDRARVVEFIDVSERFFDLLAVASRNDRLVEVHRSLTGELRRVVTLILTRADAADTVLAAFATPDSMIDHRDTSTATRTTRDVIAASRTAAMRVLRCMPANGDGVVLPLRR